MGLFQFVLHQNNIKDTNIEKLIDLTVAEEAPQIYKPRVGKRNANIDKYTAHMRNFMWQKCKGMITKLGYAEWFTDKEQEDPERFIRETNEEQLKKALYVLNEAEHVNSMFINYAGVLIRKKSVQYPKGRSSEKWMILRNKCTILDKGGKKEEKKESDKG